MLGTPNAIHLTSQPLDGVVVATVLEAVTATREPSQSLTRPETELVASSKL